MSLLRSTRARVVVGAIVAVVLAWLVVAVLTLMSARHATSAGIDELQHARDVLTPQAVVHGENLVSLRRARTSFTRARDRIDAPWMAPMRVLPVLGRQIHSADALATAARNVVDTGITAVDESRAELQRQPDTGDARLRVAHRLAEIARAATVRLANVDLGPKDALLSPLRDARDRFAGELARIRAAGANLRDASVGFGRFLEGPSHYLVLAANNNEMRVGSGTFLSVGVLDVEDGDLHVGGFLPTSELKLPEGAVTIAGDLAARWGFIQPQREWRNLAATPRFDTQAELAARMWKAATGDDVNGVLVLDPVALEALLEATGPVTVDGREYTSKNVLDELYVQQYIGVVGVPAKQERRDRLSAVARAAIDHLNRSGWKAADLVESLRHAAEGRHLLAWSRDETQRRGWEAAGIAGTLYDDSLMFGLLNAGGNKLDRFVDVRATLSVVPDARGARVQVRVRLRNRAPEGLPQYIEGPFPGLPGAAPGLYQGFLVMEMPAAVRDVSVVDASATALPLAVSGPDGANSTVGATVEVRRGQTRTFTVAFTVPAGERGLRIEPSARFPAVRWSYHGRGWDDTRVRSVRW